MTLTELPRRPYSRLRGRPEKSVTTICDLAGKPGLPFAAANETAKRAVYSTDWRAESADDAYNMLRRHFRGVWDSRAAVGTAIHAVLDSWFGGYTVDLEDLVHDMAMNESTAKSWVGREDEICELLVGYVDGAEKWWNDWQPEGGTSEECVRHPGVYVGQRDRWYVKMKGGLTWGLDYKSTAKLDPDKAIYHDSWALQMSAYKYAPEIVEYGLVEGKVSELSTRPNDLVDQCGVVHLRGDGLYSLYIINADTEAHDAFMALASYGVWMRGLGDPVEVEL